MPCCLWLGIKIGRTIKLFHCCWWHRCHWKICRCRPNFCITWSQYGTARISAFPIPFGSALGAMPLAHKAEHLNGGKGWISQIRLCKFRGTFTVERSHKYLQIRGLNLGIKNANELRNTIETLPGGPQWRTKKIPMPGCNLKEDPVLIYKDAWEAFTYIFSNSALEGNMEFAPYHTFQDESKTVRLYDQPMSGDYVWHIQVCCSSL